MRIGYFQSQSGLSGDMILASLLDAGIKREEFKKFLLKLRLDKKVRVILKKTKREGISTTHIEFYCKDEKPKSLREIKNIIKRFHLSSSIKDKAIKIFEDLAQAESKIHRKKKERIKLQEVSFFDALIEVTGTLWAVEELGIKKIVCSALPLGKGFIDSQDNKIPLPSPATLELLKNIPLYGLDIQEELTTPTGAALIKNIASDFSDIPKMKINRIGYASGKRKLPFPNILRVLIGESLENKGITEEIFLIETDIDDTVPQAWDYLIDILFQRGALDVILIPTLMKKTRPGILLRVLSTKENFNNLINTILEESSTLGVRFYRTERRIIKREIKHLLTPWGKIRVKIFFKGGKKYINPEYDDIKRISLSQREPFLPLLEKVRSYLNRETSQSQFY